MAHLAYLTGDIMKRFLTLSLFAFLLVGCTARYQVHDLNGNNSAHLNPSKDVFVVIPEDGRYGETTYASSGDTVAQSVAVAFSARAHGVRVSDTHLDKKTAMASAEKAGAA